MGALTRQAIDALDRNRDLRDHADGEHPSDRDTSGAYIPRKPLDAVQRMHWRLVLGDLSERGCHGLGGDNGIEFAREYSRECDGDRSCWRHRSSGDIAARYVRMLARKAAT